MKKKGVLVKQNHLARKTELDNMNSENFKIVKLLNV